MNYDIHSNCFITSLTTIHYINKGLSFQNNKLIKNNKLLFYLMYKCDQRIWELNCLPSHHSHVISRTVVVK